MKTMCDSNRIISYFYSVRFYLLIPETVIIILSEIFDARSNETKLERITEADESAQEIHTIPTSDLLKPLIYPYFRTG